MQTPNHIRALLAPDGNKKPTGKRLWSIDLETVWLPFFIATNTMGDTQLPHEALGAPIRLAIASDGSVKFGKSGRPMTKVAKELAEAVRLVRINFTASLQNYAGQVLRANPDGYKAEVESARVAGEPIIADDKAKLDDAIAKQMEQVLAQAEAKAKPVEVGVTA